MKALSFGLTEVSATWEANRRLNQPQLEPVKSEVVSFVSSFVCDISVCCLKRGSKICTFFCTVLLKTRSFLTVFVLRSCLPNVTSQICFNLFCKVLDAKLPYLDQNERDGERREGEGERERVTTSVWIQTRNLSIRIECLHHWAISPPSKWERCMAAWSLRHQDTNLGGREGGRRKERESCCMSVATIRINQGKK